MKKGLYTLVAITVWIFFWLIFICKIPGVGPFTLQNSDIKNIDSKLTTPILQANQQHIPIEKVINGFKKKQKYFSINLDVPMQQNYDSNNILENMKNPIKLNKSSGIESVDRGFKDENFLMDNGHIGSNDTSIEYEFGNFVQKTRKNQQFYEYRYRRINIR
ncbi:hypothetical protein EDEG_03958 [Edhazardia aedis USNM 41457]|uniref:Uncharacterized protein n=1 Tax=Edhazardia aedis (strain USNM 41457) TaxID=1003232 RepID=J9DFP7_EDHAE|nr:hypothetical protein EDEG_03958 [Edhazardia aedis USNM 41457]|eukprot:EJW01425.1 hypothetical protein EDEG_03958 [Edhazardia aedis USNM 41457]